MISDREDVVNLHMGIAKANGLRDDIQFLWSGSALANYFYQSPSDMGPGVNQFYQALYGTSYHAPSCGPGNDRTRTQRQRMRGGSRGKTTASAGRSLRTSR